MQNINRASTMSASRRIPAVQGDSRNPAMMEGSDVKLVEVDAEHRPGSCK